MTQPYDPNVAANNQDPNVLTPEQEAEVKAAGEEAARNAIRSGFGASNATMLQAKTEEAMRKHLQEKNSITRVNDKNFQYGDDPNGASEAAQRYRQWAEAAQNRTGEVIDYSAANVDRDAAQQARGAQLRVADMMANRAMGKTPSIAGMMADRQMGQAAAEQSSAAAGARGPAALALAQQGAAANTANMQSQISGQAQINGAQERMQAEQGAFGAYSGMRGGDIQAGGLASQQAQAQAQMNAAQRAQNDQAMLGMTGFETGVRTTQLGANMNKAGMQQGGAIAVAQMNAQRDAARKQLDQQQTGQAIQTGAAVAGTAAMMMSDVTAKQNVMPLGTGIGGGAGFGNTDPMGQGLPADPNRPKDWQSGGFDPGPGFNWGGLGQGLMGVSRSFAPTSGMMMSDERAKTNAFQMGQAAGLAMSGADPRAAAWDEGHAAALKDMQTLSRKSPAELHAYGNHPLALAVRGLKADAWDEGRTHGGMSQQHRGLMAQARDMGAMSSAQNQAMLQMGPSVHDPVTAQFAQGLAPSSYDYKPGMGTPGTKVGPMAQEMAANPVTSTAIRQDPNTGLLGIDRDDGLKLALAAGGHNAQKVQQLEERANEMQAMLQTQNQGLLAQGPSIGDQYLRQMRGGR